MSSFAKNDFAKSSSSNRIYTFDTIDTNDCRNRASISTSNPMLGGSLDFDRHGGLSNVDLPEEARYEYYEELREVSANEESFMLEESFALAESSSCIDAVYCQLDCQRGHKDGAHEKPNNLSIPNESELECRGATVECANWNMMDTDDANETVWEPQSSPILSAESRNDGIVNTTFH